jgi:uroporphyrinogen decarboxylase
MSLLQSITRIKNKTPHQPDFERFVRAITTRKPGPVPFGDIFADHETVGNFLGERVFDYAAMAADPEHKITFRDFRDGLRYVDQTIRFCLAHGWDYAYSFSAIPFPGFTYNLADNTSVEIKEDRQRFWVDDNTGPIQTWDDFERYPWPTNIRRINMSSHWMGQRVPPGMKVLVIPGGIFEWSTWLMGLTPFCFALNDQSDLVDAIIQKVSDTVYAVVADLMDQPGIGGIFMGDDLGFASGTMVSPQVIRTKFLPQTKRIVDLVHQAGKFFVFHSCGNLSKIMDDIIALGIDAKHSFEDKIMPVEAAYQQWGDRVGIIGGVDMHLLTTGTETEIRQRTREILDTCGPYGGYVLGTGNSVANYVPLKNYQAMLDEGRRWNHNHFGSE